MQTHDFSFLKSFSPWFSSSVPSLFLCVFAQAIINTQFHTNVYVETKYIAQCCSESLMDTSTEVRRSFFMDTVYTH